MYINLHTKSHIFLKIGILNEKVNISLKISFFLHKIIIFAPKLILTETLVILPQSLHDIIFITEENDILKQNNNFPTNEIL